MSSEVETSREAIDELGYGIESLARGLRPLHCSLDSAQNDGYENAHLDCT
jgi:hypothetical protein